MDDHIRKTAAAKVVIRNRAELAVLLGTTVEQIGVIVANPSDHYTQFTVPKANGDLRTIRPPRRVLRALQRSLLKTFYQRVQVRTCLHGGIRGKSIVTHARAHVGRVMVATFDIRKFFPSTTRDHLAPVLEAMGLVDEAARDILSLVMLEDCLPQGAPTSSLLANLAFAPGDTRFIRLCQKRRLTYSRYVDDIAISGDLDFQDLRGPCLDCIRSAGYDIAEEKVHFMPRNVRQVVTGLVVNDRLRPTRKFITELKHDIRLCLELGARVIARIEGVSVKALKSKLTGRVAHVRYIDPQTGEHLRGMLCGVDWRSTLPRT